MLSKKSFWISTIAFFGIIILNSCSLLFLTLTTANLLVSVEAKFIESVLISISAPLSSNLGLFVSIAGVIFLSDSIRVWESIEIRAFPS